MSRIQLLLTILVVVLLIVLFWFLLWTPMQDDIEAFEVRIEEEELEQATTRESIDRLREVRADAPGVEADLAAANAVIPLDPALPSALRQLQAASDEAGVVLTSVISERPVELEDAAFTAFSISVQAEGSYFQIVDLLRRLEDPAISPRGFLWDAVNMSVSEYPDLAVSLSGRIFTVAEFSELPRPEEPEEAVEPEADLDPDGEAPGDDGDVDPGADDVTEEAQ